MHNQPSAQHHHYPLAVDDTGNPFAVPTDAAFWRVRRHTTGRPHIVLGADRKPIQLPLDYSPDELLRLVGRGTYQLALCDEAGEALDTVKVTLGEHESCATERQRSRNPQR